MVLRSQTNGVTIHADGKTTQSPVEENDMHKCTGCGTTIEGLGPNTAYWGVWCLMCGGRTKWVAVA